MRGDVWHCMRKETARKDFGQNNGGGVSDVICLNFVAFKNDSRLIECCSKLVLHDKLTTPKELIKICC